MSDYNLYINGKFKDSTLEKDIINPANSETIAKVSFAKEADIECALQSARRAFDDGPWRKKSLSERKVFLLKIAEGIRTKAAELAQLETRNTGKPIKETTFMDIPSSAETFEYFANNLESFLQEKRIDITSQVSQAQSLLVPQARGVAVLIVPWNYPLLIASWKMAQAIAAGNSVILKPASLTPLSALELAKITHAAGLPEGVVNVLPCSGSEVGARLCSDSRVDMISFTGSNEVGRKILEYASSNVKKLIMELGGKSASIVTNDADLEAAVNGSLCSIFLNQGQMCTAMSRILVDETVYDKFIADFVAKTQKIKLGEGIDFQTQMGPLISQIQRQAVINYIDKARQGGAKLLCGGKIPDEPGLKKGFFLEPTVFAEAKEDSSLFQEEIFGPVVCINKFKDIDEAVRMVNNSRYALAACVWSGNARAAEKIADRLNAGTVWINTYGMFFNQVPYGGFKQSGFGKELGREGFLEYTHLKNVIVDQTQDAKPLVSYWYGF